VTMPLYEAGSVYSQVRQRKQVNSQRKLQIDETGRQVRRNAVSTWENLLTARANIESLQAQVNANRIALDGIQQEAAVGSRTVLDVL
ncbi:TolC family protein, partial [Acinetobacter baumannii]